MILLLDNYDSFTYNLAQFLGQLGEKLEVIRNDQITLDQIAAKKPKRIVISPGPGTPEDAGICVDVIKRFAGQIPILGSVPGASGDRAGIRRQSDSRAGNHARQDQPHTSRQQDDLQGFAAGFRGHALPLADCRGEIVSCRSGNFRAHRRHHHGSAPPQPMRWRACSSILNRCSPKWACSCCAIFSRCSVAALSCRFLHRRAEFLVLTPIAQGRHLRGK